MSERNSMVATAAVAIGMLCEQQKPGSVVAMRLGDADGKATVVLRGWKINLVAIALDPAEEARWTTREESDADSA